MLSRTQLHKLYPRAKASHLDAFLDRHDALFDRYGIDAHRNRLHFFLAQLGHESGGLTVTEENLNYSAARLMAVWPRRFPTLASAVPFARNPEKLANKVYAGRMGNGDAASGDGWRYRGRGYAQITGRDGYAQMERITGLPLLAEPERAADPAHALEVACAFWQWKRMDAVADAGDFIGCTRRWNGGTVGMDDRCAWLERVQHVVPWRNAAPDTEARGLDVETVHRVQTVLRSAGLYDGALDGIIGRRTRAGLRAWQADHGLAVTGTITPETLASMPSRAAPRGFVRRSRTRAAVRPGPVPSVALPA